MIGEIVPHSMKNLSVGSMGGRVGLGRGQRRVSPPSLGLAHYSGLPGQGQEETRWGDLAPETGYPVSCSFNLHRLRSGVK